MLRKHAASLITVALAVGFSALAVSCGEGGGGNDNQVLLNPPAIRAVGVSSLGNYEQPNGSGWSGINGVNYRVSNLPSLGGHGSADASDLVVMNIRVVEDNNRIAMRFKWDDPSPSLNRVQQWDGAAFNNPGGDEDRLYVMWAITDGAGRDGKTFAETGCTSACHASQYDAGLMQYLPQPKDDGVEAGYEARPAEDCGVCHENSSAATPDFSHPAVSSGGSDTCGACHTSGAGTDRWGSSHTPASMEDVGEMMAAGSSNFDIWQWMAQRTAPISILEDSAAESGQKRGRDGARLFADNRLANWASATYAGANGGEPAFVRHNAGTQVASGPILESEVAAYFAALAGGQAAALASLPADIAVFDETTDIIGTYIDSAGAAVTLTVGADVNDHILLDQTAVGDATANVTVNSLHESGQWKVVIIRDLVAPASEATTDFSFPTNIEIPFSFAITNNDGSRHFGVNSAKLLIR